MEEISDEISLPRGQLKVGITFNTKGSVKGFGPPDAEAEFDNIETVNAIAAALESAGHKTFLFEADCTLPSALAEKSVDIVFNIAEGLRGRGREAEVPALLNLLGIPFTGSDETTLCAALDKALCKRLATSIRVRTPKHALVADGSHIGSLGIGFPAIVKPNAEGSSKGIRGVCVAENAEQLRRLLRENLEQYGEPMLVEEYIPGREFTVGILGNGDKARVFSPMEIEFKGNDGGYDVYSYGVKQDYKRYIDYHCPADISPETDREMKHAAMKIYGVLGCRDFARVDFRLAPDGKLYFIEVNPLPGLAPGYSDYPMLAEFCGISHRGLVLGVLNAALERLGFEVRL